MVVKWGEAMLRSLPLDNIQHIHSLSLRLPLVPLAHSPMLTLLPMQRADSVMSIPETPIPHHFPQGREREKVEEWMLSWLYKAERTPNEYIFMAIKVTVCFGYGRLACYQVVWLSWTGEKNTIAIIEIWWYMKLYIYKLLISCAIVGVGALLQCRSPFYTF